MTNNMENLVRDLVKYGDSVGRTAIDLVISENSVALEIIAKHLGPITDSTIDDLTDFMDDDDDSWND